MAGQSDLYHPRTCSQSPGPLVSEVEFDPEEAAALSTVVGKQTKYGSTSSHTFTNQKFITHVVMPGDTLQGLALKYSVTMEQIRRANRLFHTDTLFTASVLSIPVPRAKGDIASSLSHSDSCSRHLDSSSDTESEGLNASSSIYNSCDELPVTMGSPSISLTRLDSSSHPRLKMSKKVTLDEGPEESAHDFLHRIDSSIRKTKDQVASRLRISQSQYNLQPSSTPQGPGPSRSQSMGLANPPLNENANVQLINGRGDGQHEPQDQLPALCIKAKEKKVHYSNKRVSATNTSEFQL